MATFKQRDSGWWQAVVRRKNQPPQSKTFPTKKDAEAWARDIENKIDRGVFVDKAEAEATSLSEALSRYLKEVTVRKKSHQMESYRIAVWQQHKLADRSLASLRSQDFAQYRDHRLAQGMAASTIRNELAIISHLFSTASREWNMPVTNPILGIAKPREKNERERRLLDDEEELVLSTFAGAARFCASVEHNHWMTPLFVLAIETAMRQSELVNIDWKYVDLKRRFIHLPDTKNGTSRDVPLSSRAIGALESLPRNIKGKVFPTTTDALKKAWQRALKRGRKEYESELKAQGKSQEEIESDQMLVNLHWHDLRHEATSRLAEKLQMHELMKVTGHSDSKMLARYYHPKAEDLAKKLA